LLSPRNLVLSLFSQKIPFDDERILISGQTALLKCFPASTWAWGMMIQGSVFRIDHGLEGVRDP
jgi:hypothetical protein